MAKIIVVHSRAPGPFNRAGTTHQPGRNEYPAAQFSADQLAALKAEPLFDVEERDAPDAPKRPAKAAE